MTTENTLQRKRLQSGCSGRLSVGLAAIAISCYTSDVVPNGRIGLRQHADEVVNVLPFLDFFSERLPHFSEKNRAAVQAWKNENAETIRHVEQDPALAR